MEKQAAERETERDEFSKKIEKLELKLRDVQKERSKYENIAKEVCLRFDRQFKCPRDMLDCCVSYRNVE